MGYNLRGRVSKGAVTLTLFAPSDTALAHPVGTLQGTISGLDTYGGLKVGTTKGTFSAPLVPADPSQMAGVSGHFKGRAAPFRRTTPVRRPAELFRQRQCLLNGSWTITRVTGPNGERGANSVAQKSALSSTAPPPENV